MGDKIMIGDIVRLSDEYKKIEAVDYHPQLRQIEFEVADFLQASTFYVDASAEFIGIDAEPQLLWEYSDDNMKIDSKTGLEFHVLEVLEPSKMMTYFDSAHLNSAIGTRNYDNDRDDVTVNYRLYCYQRSTEFKKTGRYYRVPAEKYFGNIENKYFDALFMEDDLLSGHNKMVTIHTKQLEYSVEDLETIENLLRVDTTFPTIHIAGVVNFVFTTDTKEYYEIIIDDRPTKVIIPAGLCVRSNVDEVMSILDNLRQDYSIEDKTIFKR